MEKLPSHLTDEILFRLPPKSLARFKCVKRAFRSGISEPGFRTGYLSRLTSGLIHGSGFGSTDLCRVPFHISGDTEASLPMKCQILGSVSGLVLLYIRELCVLNPITKTFRSLGQEPATVTLNILSIRHNRSMGIGFAVDQIDRTTQRFRVVSMKQEQGLEPGTSSYRFDVYDGDSGSWRVSQTTVACPARNISNRVKPVYFRGSLRWLRKDGSIIAFNPETEETRLIPTTFPSQGSTEVRVCLSAIDQNLTLVSATEEIISIFILRDVEEKGNHRLVGKTDPKWVFEKKIRNYSVEKVNCLFWTVPTYNGRFLVVQEVKKDDSKIRLLHGYDVVGTKKWRVLGTVPTWTDADRDFFDFSPSWFAVRGLEPWPSSTTAQPLEKPMLCLGLVMQMINPDCRLI